MVILQVPDYANVLLWDKNSYPILRLGRCKANVLRLMKRKKYQSLEMLLKNRTSTL